MSTTSSLLLLDDERKAQLDLLNKIDESEYLKKHYDTKICIYLLAAIEICNAASGYLFTGLNAKSITNAANHLQLDIEIVRTTIDSLLWLYTECAKSKIATDALDESLKLLGYSTPIRQSFIECYQSKAHQLYTTLANDLALSLPHYENLHWRFDVQIATRNMRHRKQFDPFFIVKLILINGSNKKEQVHVLQVDPLTLVHIVQQLELAMNESRNNHARRIMHTFR
ncbi:unnamed protein product [Rotaria socialis]|uniref:COMM domain-containing protein n=1 Tax=Rotaria socialis TaxID=392032 RepID=A0A821GMT4_9BILA|nr:unnamed protein product [Rotaria socialis]CAF4336225.1 unnamed protein product [Rotaria socialis]CAF4668671.1 unnamed protein product [Rotaria socialis]CAF4682805.1 unnamed protein product [Rotaria socialis]